MTFFKKCLSAILTAAIVFSLLCAGISADAAASSAIKVKSNLTDDIICEYNSNSTQITVTYYLQSSKYIVSTQGKLYYDSNVLSPVDGTNSKTAMPRFSEEGSSMVLLKKSDGEYSYNASNAYLNDFTQSEVYFTMTFDIIGNGDANINLDVTFLTASNVTENATMENDVKYVFQSEKVSDEFVFSAEGNASSNLKEIPLTHSIALDGKIGVFFNYDLPDEVLNANDVYVYFTCGHDEASTQTKVFPLSEASINQSGKYRFEYYVNSPEMTDEITAQLFVNGKRYSTVDTYSVKAYADAVIASTSGDYESIKPLVKSMLKYGAKSQLQFGYNTQNLADRDLGDYAAPELTESQISEIIDITPVETQKSEVGVDSFSNMTLVLDSDTMSRLYFNVSDESKFTSSKFTYTIDGDSNTYTAEVSKAGDRYVVDIPGIASSQLGKQITLTIRNGRYSYLVTFCANSYIKKALTTPDVPDTLKATVTALYNYNQCAVAYFG